MALTDSPSFPLVRIEPVANLQNAWVSLAVRVGEPAPSSALQAIFGAPDLLAAIAPLNCVLMLDSPAVLDPSLLALMPPSRVAFAVRADALNVAEQAAQLAALHEKGYRILLDGPVAQDTPVPPGLTAVSQDVSVHAPGPKVLPLVFGPHLAHGVDTPARQAECARVGFEWFSGDYPLNPAPTTHPHDGSSRKRLMTLLGQLARDADTRELESLLKQDPSLSYHLLKLANSAAFAHSAPITSFGQAISILGRRQLQRWLQLLLYARQQADGLPNLLLPIAGQRAAQMEMLCKLQGGERDQQDLAFMTGVFSLLHLLFGMTMEDIVGALNLPTIATDALLTRSGPFGQLLAMIEAREATPEMLDAAAITPVQWWNSQLHAYHWAIQVSRNL